MVPKFDETNKKKSEKRMTLKDFDQRISDICHNSKTKMILDFDPSLAYSMKCFVINKNNFVKRTFKFFNKTMWKFFKQNNELKQLKLYESVETFF